MEFADLWMASPARIALENVRPSRARSGVARTLRREELEERLDRMAECRHLQWPQVRRLKWPHLCVLFVGVDDA
jgi:hypothetical protein